MPPKKFKIAIIGDTAAGKTALRKSLINEEIPPLYKSTLGGERELGTKYLHVDDIGVELEIWEFTKGELFDCFKGNTDAVTVCVSPSEKISDQLIDDIAFFKDINRNIIITIVSTKADLLDSTKGEEHKQLVERVEQLKDFAKDNGYVFHQVSAKTNHGVKDLFINVASTINKKKSSVEETPSITTINSEKPLAEETPSIKNALSKLIERINELNQSTTEETAFQQALLQLTQILEQKKRFTDVHTINAIVAATNKLLDDINQVEDKEDIKAMFKTYRDDCPTQAASLLNKLIRTVIITGIFMVVGAALATGICLSLGVGLGVGAGIVASAGAAGFLSSGIAFFRKNDIEKSLDNVVKTGKTMLKDDLSPSSFVTA